MACFEASATNDIGWVVLRPLPECWVGPSVPGPAASVDGALLQVVE